MFFDLPNEDTERLKNSFSVPFVTGAEYWRFQLLPDGELRQGKGAEAFDRELRSAYRDCWNARRKRRP